MMKLKRLIQIFLAAAALLIPTASLAIQGESVTVSPATQRFSVNPGGSVTGQLVVINDGTVANDYEVSAAPFGVTGEDYESSFKLPDNVQDASKWFTFTKRTIHLEPSQRTTVNYVVNLPANASPGGHYATLFVTTLPQPGSGTVVSKKRVGTIFYLTANGDVQSAGQLLDFNANFWQTNPPLDAKLRVQNDGNVHFDAETKLTVTDIFGNTKATINTTSLVFPKTVRRITISWEQAPKFGLFKVSGTVKYLDKTETLKPHYVLMMSVKFFLIMLAAVIILLLVALSKRRKRRGHRR